MGNNLELKIYEKLGIKYFRKIVLGLKKILLYPATIKMSESEKRQFLSTPSNYNMKKGNGLQDLKDFKKYLMINSSIHIYGLYLSLHLFFNTIDVSAIIVALSMSIINVYCIMLQRYNWIRINNIIKKYAPQEEKKKEKIRDEVIKIDSLIPKHTFTLIKKPNEKEATLDELIGKYSLKELKEIRKYLDEFRKLNSNFSFHSEELLCINNQKVKIKVK